MDNIDVVIVICGEDAYLAKGVAAELTIAQEKNKPYSSRRLTHTGLAQGQQQQRHHKIYEWTWGNVKTLIGGWR